MKHLKMALAVIMVALVLSMATAVSASPSARPRAIDPGTALCSATAGETVVAYVEGAGTVVRYLCIPDGQDQIAYLPASDNASILDIWDSSGAKFWISASGVNGYANCYDGENVYRTQVGYDVGLNPATAFQVGYSDTGNCTDAYDFSTDPNATSTCNANGQFVSMLTGSSPYGGVPNCWSLPGLDDCANGCNEPIVNDQPIYTFINATGYSSADDGVYLWNGGNCITGPPTVYDLFTSEEWISQTASQDHTGMTRLDIGTIAPC